MERNGSDPLSQYKAKGQFCYSIDSNWRRRLNGNYPSYVVQAVTDALMVREIIVIYLLELLERMRVLI